MALSSNSGSLLNIAELSELKNVRVAIVKTEWNDSIVQLQTEGAKAIANEANAQITSEIIVPGSVEIPFAVKRLYEATKNQADAPEAIITFGAVIRGGTPHFDYVCQMVTDGVLQLNLSLPIPIIFGVLTLDNEEQAMERLGGSHGHKGEEAMITALKMIALNRKLHL